VSSHGAASAKKDSEATAVHVIGQCEERDDGGRRGEKDRAERDADHHPGREVDRRLADQRSGVGPGAVDGGDTGGDDGDGHDEHRE
jgi:hypothetical protein